MRYHEYMLKGGQGDREMTQKYKDDEGNIYYVDRLGRVTDDTGFTFRTNLHDHAASWVFSDLTPIEIRVFNWDARVEKNNEKDQVNSPSHYGQGSIECIEYIRDSLTHEEYLGYLQGNLKKYTHRWRYKKGVEDLKKADVYLTWLIEAAEKGDKG